MYKINFLKRQESAKYHLSDLSVWKGFAGFKATGKKSHREKVNRSEILFIRKHHI